MTVMTPPPPVVPDAPQDPEALLEEARRRARRRRRRNAVAVLLVGVAAIGGAAHGFGGGSPNSAPAIHNAAPVVAGTTPSQQIHNGPLTVIKQSQGRGGVFFVGRNGLGRLVVPCHYTQTTCLELWFIAWSPDGDKIAFDANSIAGVTHYDGLHVIDLRTGRDTKLTGDGAHAAWSPDGRWLAYDGPGRGRISLVRADGSRRGVVLTGTPGWASSPTWSPDGSRLAFASGADRCQAGGRRACAIYVVRRDGTHLHLLAHHAAAPAWSPLGTTIAYQAQCGIRLVTPTGADATPPSNARCQHIGLPGEPVWSPDGHQIAVNYGPGKNQGLYVMNADGTNLTLLTRTTGHRDSGIARAAWRPRPAAS